MVIFSFFSSSKKFDIGSSRAIFPLETRAMTESVVLRGFVRDARSKMVSRLTCGDHGAYVILPKGWIRIKGLSHHFLSYTARTHPGKMRFFMAFFMKVSVSNYIKRPFIEKIIGIFFFYKIVFLPPSQKVMNFLNK